MATVTASSTSPSGVAASRYAVGGSTPTVDYNTTGNGTTSGSTTGSTTGATNQSATQTGTSTTVNNQTVSTLGSADQALLRQLIQSLMAQNQTDEATKSGVINNTGQEIQQYSKASAFGDAQGLMAQTMRRALEATLPSINRAAEDAGSSGGALRALLMQDAANKAAESSAAQGMQAAGTYGQISTNLTNTLANLLNNPTGASSALIQAMNTLKGATTTTNGTQTTNSQNTTNSSGTTSGTTSQNTTGNTSEAKSVDYAPFAVTNSANTASGNNNFLYVGPTAGNSTLSNDLLSRLSTNHAFDDLFI